MRHLDPLYFTSEATFSDIVNAVWYGNLGVPFIEQIDYFMSDARGEKWDRIFNILKDFLAFNCHIFKSPLPYMAVLREVRLALEIRRDSQDGKKV